MIKIVIINKIKTNINLYKFVNLCNYLNGLDFSTTKLLPGSFFFKEHTGILYYLRLFKTQFLTFFYRDLMVNYTP